MRFRDAARALLLFVVGVLPITPAAAQHSVGPLPQSSGPPSQDEVLPEFLEKRFAPGYSRIFGTPLWRGDIRSLAYAPDGEHVATSSDEAIQFWDPATGIVVDELRGSFADFTALDFSADGTLLVAAGVDGRFAVWDLVNRRELVTKSDGEFSDDHTAVKLFPDNARAIVCREDLTAHVFDIKTGETLASIELGGESRAPPQLAVPPSGRTFAVSGASKLRIFDGGSYQELHAIDIPDDIRSFVYLSDEELLSASWEQTAATPRPTLRPVLKVWNVKTGELARRLPTDEIGEAWALLLMADRKRAVAMNYKQLTLFDTATGETISQFPLGEMQLYGIPGNLLGISPDGKHIAVGCSRRLLVFDMNTGKQLAPPDAGHVGDVSTCAPSPDGLHLATFALVGREVLIWDAATSELVDTISFQELDGRPEQVIWSADGGILYVTGVYYLGESEPFPRHTDLVVKGFISAYDLNRRESLFERKLDRDSPIDESGSLSADGEMLAVPVAPMIYPRVPGSILLLNARNGETLREIEQSRGQKARYSRFSADGARLITLGEQQFDWDVATGELLHSRELGDYTQSAQGFSADGTLILMTSSGDGAQAWVVDAATLEELHRFQVPDEHVYIASFSGDDDWVITSSVPMKTYDGEQLPDREAKYRHRVWDAKTGQVLHRLPDTRSPLHDLRLSADGDVFYAGTQFGVTLAWDLEPREPISIQDDAAVQDEDEAAAGDEIDAAQEMGASQVFGALHLRGGTHTLAYSPDGEHLLGDSYGRIRVWNAETGQHVQDLATGLASITGMTFSPDGTRLACCGYDSKISVWDWETRRELFSKTNTEEDALIDVLTSVAWSPDGKRLVTPRADHGVVVWNAETGEVIASLLGETRTYDAYFRAAYSPDGKTYAIAGLGSVRVYDAEQHELLHAFPAHQHTRLAGLAYLSAAEILTCGAMQVEVNGQRGYVSSFKVWNAATGEVSREVELPMDESPAAAAQIIADGASILVKSSKALTTYDLQSGKPVHEFAISSSGSSLYPHGLAVAPGEDQITYVGNSRIARVHDAETGARLFPAEAGHDGAVRHVSISPDSAVVASSGGDGKVLLWDAETSALIHVFDCGAGVNARQSVWSADGSKLYVVALRGAPSQRTGVIYAFNAVAKTKLYETELSLTAGCCALSPDGRKLYVVANQTGTNIRDRTIQSYVEVFDTANGRSLRRIDAESEQWDEVSEIAISADGRTLYSLAMTGDSPFYRAWNTDTWEQLEAPPQILQVAFAALAPDRSQVVGVNNRTGEAVIVDAATGNVARTFKLPNAQIGFARQSPDGKQLVTVSMPVKIINGRAVRQAGAGVDVTWWDYQSGEVLDSKSGVQFLGRDLWFSPDGKKVYGHTVGMVLAFDFGDSAGRPPSAQDQSPDQQAKERLNVDKLYGSAAFRGSGVRGVAFSADGKRIYSSTGRKIVAWDLESGLRIDEWPLSMEYCHKLLLSPDGTRLAAFGRLGSLIVWDIQTHEELWRHEEDRANRRDIHSIAWSPDSERILGGGTAPEVFVWDAETGEELVRKPNAGRVMGTFQSGWSPDGGVIACGAGDPYSVYLYDGDNYESLGGIQTEQRINLAGMAFLSETELITCGDLRREIDGRPELLVSLRIWDVKTYQMVREVELPFPTARAQAMGLSPDRKSVVVASWDGIHCYDVESGRLQWQSLKIDGEPQISFSPDGKYVAFAHRHSGGVTLRLHDMWTGGRIVADHAGHDNRLSEIAVSPDSSMLATCDTEGNVMFWDAETREVLASFSCGWDASPLSCAWSADSRRFYAMHARKAYGQVVDEGALFGFDAIARAELFETGYEFMSAHSAVSHDGRVLAVAGYDFGRAKTQNVSLLDAASGRVLSRVDDIFGRLAFSPNDKLLYVIGSDKNGNTQIQTLDLTTRKITVNGSIAGVAIGREVHFAGTKMAITTETSTLAVADAESRQLLREFKLDGRNIVDCTISPDGKWVAGSSQPADYVFGENSDEMPNPYSIHIWDAESGELLRTISDLPFPGYNMRISADRKTLYVNSPLALVAAWDLSALGD